MLINCVLVLPISQKLLAKMFERKQKLAEKVAKARRLNERSGVGEAVARDATTRLEVSRLSAGQTCCL